MGKFLLRGRILFMTCVLWCALGKTAGVAAQRFVDDFTALSDATFIDVHAFPMETRFRVGDLSISTEPPFYYGSFTAWPPGTAENPGDGSGYIEPPQTPPVQLTFSQPVVAFGVSFMHMTEDRFAGASLPARMEAYSGADLTGLIGTATSSGLIGSGLYTHDFVGIWSDAPNILSVKLIWTNPAKPGFAVDGYGVIVPEPAGVSVVFFAVTLMCRRKRNMV